MRASLSVAMKKLAFKNAKQSLISISGLRTRFPAQSCWSTTMMGQRNYSMTFMNQALFSSNESISQEVIDEVEANVFKVLKSASKCNVDKLSRTATFEELGFDSLDGVELVVAMEETFGFDITNEEAEKITNVQEAVTIFAKNLTTRINSLKSEEELEEQKKK